MNRKQQLPRFLWATLFLVLAALPAAPQGAGGRRGAAQPAQPAQQAQQVVQPFVVGDPIEFHSPDGSWVAGNIRNFDPATGSYEVVLTNGTSGWTPPAALKRVGTPNAQPAAPGPAAPAQPGGQAAAGGAACGTDPKCYETRNFSATVTDFRVSSQGSNRIVDATVRFVNKTGDPLALGYVDASGDIIDDRGNRFTVKTDDTVRGVGIIKGDAVDPKFVLQPGDTGDTQFQFVFEKTDNTTVGTSFELRLTVRALNAVAADQYKPGSEYPLHFSGLGQTPVSVSSSGSKGKKGGGSGSAPQQADGGQPGQSSGQSKGNSLFSSLQQAAGSIPGLSKTPAAAGAQTGAAGAQGATGAKGNTASQLAAYAGGAQQIASQTGAPQPAQTAITQASSAIPGLSKTPVPSATSVISGLSATPTQSPQPGLAPTARAAAVTPPVPAAPPVAAPPVPAAALPAADPCANKPHCFNYGAFAAEVAVVAGGQTAKGYGIRTQIVFVNPTAQAVVLGYVPNSAVASDNAGNRYTTTMNGAIEEGVTGMPADNAVQGARFVLGPRQQRAVGLVLLRPVTATGAVGTEFNLSMQVGELSAATGPANLVGRQPVTLANVTCQCGAVPAANNTANTLRNALIKKK